MHIHLKLTEAEANALISLIDAGVRATGLNAAEAAANLFNKIKSAPQVEGEELIEGAEA
jgi:hypothetical protein